MLFTFIIFWFDFWISHFFYFQGGAYMLQLMDTYCGGWAILIIGISECAAIAWVYGKSKCIKMAGEWCDM